MDKKWKKVAKENLESLKNVDPDKASKDQYLLYAASIAMLDHAEQQNESVQFKLENTDDKTAYNEYMDSKRVYRDTKDDAAKQCMVSTLDRYMNGLSSEIEELIRDADCHEERKMIKKYLNKIQSV